ncbi:MAG: hypothetical protein M1822_003707 [Bathelium mastoideum]|nr:MAG: hypothetical protein M1822_003707 [Bathelium mastoideum]
MNHPPYSQGPSPEHVNGTYHNGVPLSHHEHPPTPMSYAPVPYGPGHAPPTPYSYAPNGTHFGVGPRKKHVRATQACDACRQRKQKCNEERPCAFCSEVGLKCEYREVPPPKQDRSMMQLMDKLAAMADSQARIEELTEKSSKDFRRRLEAVERSLSIKDSELMSPMEDSKPPRTEMDVEPSRDRSYSQETSSAAYSKTNQLTGTENHTPALPAAPRLTATVSKSEHQDQDDDVFIPIQHITGAHNMLKWSILQQLIDLDEILPKDLSDKVQYPGELEIRRGQMKLYGRGEGPKHGDRSVDSPGTPSANENADDAASNCSIATDSTWGTGLPSPPNMNQPLPRLESDIGGLNPDGTLKLDRNTIDELYQSFLESLWLIHPCIPKDSMNKLIKNFTHHYSYDSNPSSRSPFAHGHDLMGNDLSYKKRKRSHASVYVSGVPGSPDGMGQRSSRALPERSINNAIVLLILALGKISLHKKAIPPFPGDAKEPSLRPSVADSPLTATKPSPVSTASLQSPNPDPHQLTPRSGTASIDGYAQNSQRDPARKNTDVIPGLAYYAYATDILGNHNGAHDTPNAQAYILAAVYAAQDRVAEKEPDDYHNGEDGRMTKKGARKDNIRFLYWTCLQLESDILADLDMLAPSALYNFETKIAHPLGVLEDMPEPPELANNMPQDMMLCYSGQIHIRRFLNKLHRTSFYKQSERRNPGSRNDGANQDDSEPEWEGDEPQANTYKRMTTYLDGWKALIPAHLQWDEETDPPARDINGARLRAKYYGARYVLNRPMLLQAIRPYGVGQKKWDLSEETTMRAARTAVAAAMRSTVAFDGLGDGLADRLIVTNIFGTAHAQFGNCLMLAATHKSGRLSHLVQREELDRLLHRTIRFLSNYEAHSPTLKYDKRILEYLRDNLDKPIELMKSTSMSASSSFGSN